MLDTKRKRLFYIRASSDMLSQGPGAKWMSVAFTAKASTEQSMKKWGFWALSMSANMVAKLRPKVSAWREEEEEEAHYKKNTLPWWYVFVTVGRIFCHTCTSMAILWQNEDSHTCAVVEVFHDITKIIITEVSTSMTINCASQKCFRQGWPTHGIHRNGTPLSYRVGFWIR